MDFTMEAKLKTFIILLFCFVPVCAQLVDSGIVGDPTIVMLSVQERPQPISCTVGRLNADRTRTVTCILPDAECDEVWCQGTRFNIREWPEAWKGKKLGATVWASWEDNRITPVTGSCEERIRKRALELAHLTARQDIDIVTPPDCHHLSEEKRLAATKERDSAQQRRQ